MTLILLTSVYIQIYYTFFSYIHEIGGIVVADEIQCGMGRTGETFWAFQGQNAVPDIITVGKPLGNGHPIGAVITSRKIAATIKSAEHIVSPQVFF